MKLIVGLDVSLAKTAVCGFKEHGKIVREMAVASEPEPLISLLGGSTAPLKRSISTLVRCRNGCTVRRRRQACLSC